MRYFFLVFLLCGPRFSAAQGPVLPVRSEPAPAAISTATEQGSALILNISKNARDSRVGLDYTLRWSFRDLLSVRPRLSTIVSGVKAISEWDITENTRVNYYGFRTNPWKMILAREKIPAAGAAAGTDGTAVQNGVVKHSTYRRRVKFSVSPLVDDIKQNFDEQLREMLLLNSLKKTSPTWQKAGKEGREAIVHDVLSLGVWQAPLPGIEQGREGLEYLGEKKRR